MWKIRFSTTGLADRDIITDKKGTIMDLQWSQDSTPLTSFDNGSDLPQVVKIGPSLAANARPLPPGLKVYAGQPLLFYICARKKHALARTIYREREGAYFEVGQTFDIPEDFEGWFEIVPPDFSRAPVFVNISQLAEAQPRKFFSRTNIKVLCVGSEGNDDDKSDANITTCQHHDVKQRIIEAGTVLTVQGTFVAKWQTKAQAGLIRKKSKEYETVAINYLKCLDIDGEEVLIPLTTRGKFNIVYEHGVKDNRTVYRIKDILSDFKLPLKVRMTYGRSPTAPCIFSGMLIIKDQYNMATIIASTVLNKRNVLLEVPVSTECDVNVAVNEDDYVNLDSFIDAKMLCQKYANSYSCMIKLSPELDTGQQVIQHIPTEKPAKRNESLQTLDLITNIRVADEKRESDLFETTDSDSISSAELAPLDMGLMNLTEIVLPHSSISNA